MTREELVKELNKIKGVKANFSDYERVEIKYGVLEFVYLYVTTKSVFANPPLIIRCAEERIMFFDRTPEQVLSAVKALVE